MQKPSKFYLFVIILSVSLTMSYMRGRYSYSAVISCYSDFPDLRYWMLRGMQQIISELPRQTCREIKSSMTLEEEQFLWLDTWLVLFSEGTGRAVCIRLYIYNQQNSQKIRTFLQREEFWIYWTKKCVRIKSSFDFIRNEIQEMFLFEWVGC